MVHAALDAGITFFDTANVYRTLSVFDQPGAAADREGAEAILGRALQGRRDEVVLATKSGVRRRGPGCPGATSSSRSRTACGDCSPTTSTFTTRTGLIRTPPLEQTLAAYDDLVRQGKLRYVAMSNFPAWQVAQALWIADDRHLHAPVAAQVKYSLIDRAPEQELAAPRLGPAPPRGLTRVAAVAPRGGIGDRRGRDPG